MTPQQQAAFWKRLDRQFSDGANVPPFLRLTAAQRHEAWRRNPPRAMPMIPDEYAARQREMDELRKQASLTKLKRSVERNKGRRDQLPKDFNTRDYRWDPRKCRFIQDELARLAKPASGLIERTDPLPPHRNHVERRASKRPARQFVSETHHHKPDAPAKDDLPERIKARFGMDVVKLKAFAQANEVWDDKYAKLPNPGLVRMIVCNRVRNLLKKGKILKWPMIK